MTAAPRHFPFRANHDPRRMGVSAIESRDWFEIDENYGAQLAEKERLLAARHGEVFAAQPESAAAMREVLAAVSRWALERGAGFMPGRASVRCPDGRCVALDSTNPLEAAARLVQEDLCLLQQDEDGTLILTAACLCFPSRWVLAEKLGRPMPAIHAPVPGLNDRIGATIDRFLSGLKAGTIYMRTNWSLTTDEALFQPVALPHAPIAAGDAGERVFYRVERQTLRRLPETGVVLFAIRIHQHPLSALKANPEIRDAFAAAVAALDPALTAYKSMSAIRDSVLAYLGKPS